jgi:hypothetical protein
MKSKGYAPSKHRGKGTRPKVQDERGEAVPMVETEQAWAAGDSKEQTKAGDATAGVMRYFPDSRRKRRQDQVVQLAGAVGEAEPAGPQIEVAKQANTQVKQDEKAKKKQLAQEEKERKRLEKEKAKRAKIKKQTAKEALYADPEPEDLKPNGDDSPDDGAP